MRRLLQAMCVLLVMSMAVPLSAQESIQDARERREQIQREAAEAAAELDVLAAEDQALVEALDRLDAWIAAEDGRLQAVRQELAATREAGEEARRNADALGTQIDELARLVAQQSVDSYVAGFDGEDSLLLSTDNINAVPVLRFIIDEANGSSADTTALLRTARSLQEDALAEAETAETATIGLRDEIRVRMEALEDDRATQAQLRAEVETRIGSLESTSAQLAAEDAEITDFIRAEEARIAEQARVAEEARLAEQARLEAERLAAEEAANGGADEPPTETPTVPEPVPAPPGGAPAFIRPVGGALTSPFGTRIHPVYGTSRFHAGIDFDGASGSPIAAASSGTVIFADVFDGYGNTVIIDHGGGYTSLYAHMSGFNTSAGASVSAGTTIGFIGTTGVSTGPHLHFEIRISGVAVDPAPYL